MTSEIGSHGCEPEQLQLIQHDSTVVAVVVAHASPLGRLEYHRGLGWLDGLERLSVHLWRRRVHQAAAPERPATGDVTRWLGAVMSSWCSDLARPLDAFEIQNQFLRNIEIHQFGIYNFIKFINFIYNFMNFQIVPDVSGFAGLERWRLWLRERGSPAKEAPKTPEFLSWREAKISFGQCQSMKNTQFLRGAHELQFVTPVSRKPMPYCSESGWWKLEFFYTLHLWKLFANPLFMLASNMFELCCTLHVVMTIDTLAISQHPKRWKSNL